MTTLAEPYPLSMRHDTAQYIVTSPSLLKAASGTTTHVAAASLELPLEFYNAKHVLQLMDDPIDPYNRVHGEPPAANSVDVFSAMAQEHDTLAG